MYYYVLRKYRVLPLITVVLLVGGCAFPKNAEEHRAFARRVVFNNTETFVVPRSFEAVTATLRQKEKECLKVSITWHCTNCFFDSKRTVTFKTTFVDKPNRTELHLQRQDGIYRIVLDAFPAGSNRTKIDIYVSSSIEDKLLRDAFRGWAQGTNLGCPDMTQL